MGYRGLENPDTFQVDVKEIEDLIKESGKKNGHEVPGVFGVGMKKGITAAGKCDICDRKNDDPPYSSCYFARNKLDGLYILGKDFVLLECAATDYRQNSLYLPLKPKD